VVVLFLVVEWASLSVADKVRDGHPDLDVSYVPQHFAMEWMRATVYCSLLATIAAAVSMVRFILRILATADRES
jgi:hypothetical protein